MATSKKSKTIDSSATDAGDGDQLNDALSAAGIQALVPAAQLKASFKEGSIPLEGDFANLIDLAAAGATAAGAMKNPAAAGQGLTLNSLGILEAKPYASAMMCDAATSAVSYTSGSALSVSTAGLTLALDKAIFEIKKGLSSHHFLGMKLSDGLKAGAGNVGLQANLKTSAGLIFDSGAIGIGQGNGITVAGTVSVKAGSGITVDSDGVKVKADGSHGITVDSGGVIFKPGNGLEMDSYGVKVKKGDGISVGAGGVTLDLATAVYDTSNYGQFGGLKLTGGKLGLKLASKVMSTTGAGENTTPLTLKFLDNGLEELAFKLHGDHFTTSDWGSLKLVHPLAPGMVMMFAGDIPPKNWILCDGTNEKAPNLIDDFKEDVELSKKSKRTRYSLTYIMLTDDEDGDGDSDDDTPPSGT